MIRIMLLKICGKEEKLENRIIKMFDDDIILVSLTLQ